MNEIDYTRGTRHVWLSLLRQCLRELGYDKAPVPGALIVEREEAIQALRDVCEDHGDNDWTEDLHLADVIHKHLGRHLDDKLGT